MSVESRSFFSDYSFELPRVEESAAASAQGQAGPYPEIPPLKEPEWMDEPIFIHEQKYNCPPVSTNPRELLQLLSTKLAIPLAKWRLIGGANRAAMDDAWLRQAVKCFNPDATLPDQQMGCHETMPDYDFFVEVGDVDLHSFRQMHQKIIELIVELHERVAGDQPQITFNEVLHDRHNKFFRQFVYLPSARLLIFKLGQEDGKQIEIKIAAKLERDHLFSVDGFYRTMDDLTTLRSVRPQPWEGVLDFAQGVIRCDRPEQVNHKGWPRYLSYLTRGFRLRQENLSEILFKTCATEGPEEFLLNLEDCLEGHHAENLPFAAAYLINATLELIRIGEDKFASELWTKDVWERAKESALSRALRKGSSKTTLSALEKANLDSPSVALAQSLIGCPESLQRVLQLLKASAQAIKSPITEHDGQKMWQLHLPAQEETVTILVPYAEELRWELLETADLTPYFQWMPFLLKTVRVGSASYPASCFLEKKDFASRCFGAALAAADNGHQWPCLREDWSESSLIRDLIGSDRKEYRNIGYRFWKENPCGDLSPLIKNLVEEKEDITLAISLFQTGMNVLNSSEAKRDLLIYLSLRLKAESESHRLSLLPRLARAAAEIEGDPKLSVCIAWLIRELIEMKEIDAARQIFQDKRSLPPYSCLRVVSACKFVSDFLTEGKLSEALELWEEELRTLPRGNWASKSYLATIKERDDTYDLLLDALHEANEMEKLSRLLRNQNCKTNQHPRSDLWIETILHWIATEQHSVIWERWNDLFPQLVDSESPEKLMQLIGELLQIIGKDENLLSSLYKSFSQLIQKRSENLSKAGLFTTALQVVEKVLDCCASEQRRAGAIEKLLEYPILDCASIDSNRVDSLVGRFKGYFSKNISSQLREKLIRFYLAEEQPQSAQDFVNDKIDPSLSLDFAACYLNCKNPNAAKAGEHIRKVLRLNQETARVSELIPQLVLANLEQGDGKSALQWIGEAQAFGPVQDLIRLSLDRCKIRPVLEANLKKNFISEEEMVHLILERIHRLPLAERGLSLQEIKELLPKALDSQSEKSIQSIFQEILEADLDSWPLLSTFPELCKRYEADAWKKTLMYLARVGSPIILELSQNPAPLLFFVPEKERPWMEEQLMSGLVKLLDKLKAGKRKACLEILLSLRERNPAEYSKEVDPVIFNAMLQEGTASSLLRAGKIAHSVESMEALRLVEAISATTPIYTKEMVALRDMVCDLLRIFIERKKAAFIDKTKLQIAPWIFHPEFANDTNDHFDLLLYFIGYGKEKRIEIDGRIVFQTYKLWLNASGPSALDVGAIILDEIAEVTDLDKEMNLFVPLYVLFLQRAVEQKNSEFAIKAQKFLYRKVPKCMSLLKPADQEHMLAEYGKALRMLLILLESERMQTYQDSIEHPDIQFEIQNLVHKLFTMESKNNKKLCALFLNTLIPEAPSGSKLEEQRGKILLNSCFSAFYALIQYKGFEFPECKLSLKNYLEKNELYLQLDPPNNKYDPHYLLKPLQMQLQIALASNQIVCSFEKGKAILKKKSDASHETMLTLRREQCLHLREIPLEICENLLVDLNMEITQTKVSLLLNQNPYFVNNKNLDDYSVILKHLYQEETDEARKEQIRGLMSVYFLTLNSIKKYNTHPQLFEEHYTILYGCSPVYNHHDYWPYLLADICQKELSWMCKNQTVSVPVCHDLLGLLLRANGEVRMSSALMRNLAEMFVEIAITFDPKMLRQAELIENIQTLLVDLLQMDHFDFADPKQQLEFLSSQALIARKLPENLLQKTESVWDILLYCIEKSKRDRGVWTERFCTTCIKLFESCHIFLSFEQVKEVYQEFLKIEECISDPKQRIAFYYFLRCSMLKIAALVIQPYEDEASAGVKSRRLFQSLWKMSIPADESQWLYEITVANAFQEAPSKQLYLHRAGCLNAALKEGLFEESDPGYQALLLESKNYKETLEVKLTQHLTRQ